MTYTTTVTQKGQVTIPMPLRKQFKINKGNKVKFFTDGSKIIVKPVLNLLDLKGSIKSKIKYSDQMADKAVLEYAAKEYLKKMSRCT